RGQQLDDADPGVGRAVEHDPGDEVGVPDVGVDHAVGVDVDLGLVVTRAGLVRAGGQRALGPDPGVEHGDLDARLERLVEVDRVAGQRVAVRAALVEGCSHIDVVE